MPRYSTLRAALAALALVLCGAPAAMADTANVTVRIEGAATTLVPQTPVTLDSTQPEPVSGCPGLSVAAAINKAVNGNWDHGEANNGGGDFTETIMGETHDFSNNSDTWAEWVDYKWGGGICTDMLHDGDSVVMIADHEPPPYYAPTRLPLTVSGAPSPVQAGSPFTVNVQEIHTPPNNYANPGDGTPEPAQGAVVAGGGTSATADANGNATLTLNSTGTVTLRATKSGDAPSATFTVCVHNGNDGNCGTQAPAPTPPPSAPAAATPPPPPAPLVLPPSAYRGPFAVVAQVLGVIDGHVYRHGHAPRLITGRALSQNRVTAVMIRLHRVRHGHCQAYGGRSERFYGARCGAAAFFQISSNADFSYLLPSALPRGRYVLDVLAFDALGDRSSLARGASRTVFYVR